MLAPDRLKNIDIVLSRLKISSQAVMEALFNINFVLFTQEKIELMFNAAPDDSEVELFREHPPELI